MLKLLGMSTILLACGFALGQTGVKLSEKFQKKVEAADATFQQAVAKAENAKFYAVQKANADRVKVLKQAMTEATKAGDLDAANEIKDRLAETELVDVPDPSNTTHNRPLFLSAVYGVNQSWKDVTDKLNQLAQKKGPLKVRVTDELFGDPAPNFSGGNTLVARYYQNGKTGLLAVYVDGELSIP